MAGASLPNSSSNLNLTRRQLAIFQKIILTGTEMSEAIKYIDEQFDLPNDLKALEKKWSNLMVQFAHMLLQSCET